MRHVLLISLIWALTCGLWSGSASADWPQGETIPFGLIVGHNQGGEGMQRLHYAHRDAQKFRDVFTELGGLSSDRIWMVLSGDADEVTAALAEVEDAIRRAKDSGQTALLLFYYSGHAKDGHLRLGDTRLPMGVIKDWLRDSKADVRLAFVDACQSGEITRLKGGTLAPSLVVMEHTRGHIIVTSSAASEGSQESDDIGGSFFTHFLVSGLRGDADNSGDGTVSLREIYEYAYNRTVNRTASTRGGTQHPTYGYELAGRGEVPLTRIAMLDSGLQFPAALEGRYLVYDLDGQRISAELDKKPGTERFIAVPPGRYVVKKRRASDMLLGQLEVRDGEKFVIRDEDLLSTAFENDTTKGLVVVRERTWQIGYSMRGGAEAYFDAPTREDVFYSSIQAGFELTFHDLLAENLSLSFDFLLAGGTDETTLTLETGVTQTVAANFFRLQIGTGLYYHLDWSWFGLYAGPRLTLLMASRTFGEPLKHYPAQTFGTLSPGAALGLAFHIGHWDLFLEGRVNYVYYNIDGDASLGYGGGYVGVAYRH
jgi:hypothetical protein